MQAPSNLDLGIREIRTLTSLIMEKHGADYSEYALTSLKRRIEKFMTSSNCSMETLLTKLETKEFFDHFARHIAVAETEMFRDPTFWIMLKNNYIANLLKEHARVRIWLPLCTSGEEYYSLAILLHESGWTDRTETFVSGRSEGTLETIRNGWLDSEKTELSSKNYLRFQGARQLPDYFTAAGNMVTFNRSLFANTTFFKDSIQLAERPEHVHLILFRNKMIYFNSSLQHKMCDRLQAALTAKGLLALGILEEIDTGAGSKFSAVNKQESIYQKRT